MKARACIYNIASNYSRAVENELNVLVAETKKGNLSGVSYAATSHRKRLLVGCAGTHDDPDKAISAMFRAAVSLSMAT